MYGGGGDGDDDDDQGSGNDDKEEVKNTVFIVGFGFTFLSSDF